MRKSSVEGAEKRFGKIFFVGLWSVGRMRKKSANLRECVGLRPPPNSPIAFFRRPASAPAHRLRRPLRGRPNWKNAGEFLVYGNWGQYVIDEARSTHQRSKIRVIFPVRRKAASEKACCDCGKPTGLAAKKNEIREFSLAKPTSATPLQGRSEASSRSDEQGRRTCESEGLASA